MTLLRFHWRLVQGGERGIMSRAKGWDSEETALPELDWQAEFCRAAEKSGMDSLLLDFGYSKPDPILLAAALGPFTERIKFIIAWRSGLTTPTWCVQQLNTLSSLINGRLSLNIVAGHSPQEQRGYGDFLAHDERYARTEEFLAICHAFWRGEDPVNFKGRHYTVEGGRLGTPFISPDQTFPELYIAGNSEQARNLAISQGSCWMTLAEAPEKLAPRIPEVLRHGRTVGVRCAVIARPTRAEAIEAAHDLLANLSPTDEEAEKEREFVRKSDSASIASQYQTAENEGWLTPYLWTGAVHAMGPATVCIVGSPEEVAEALLEYKRIGVTQFILAGWPKLEQMLFFGREVLPLVREREAEVAPVQV
jgi:alkanesulfonate monooxygenase